MLTGSWLGSLGGYNLLLLLNSLYFHPGTIRVSVIAIRNIRVEHISCFHFNLGRCSTPLYGGQVRDRYVTWTVASSHRHSISRDQRRSKVYSNKNKELYIRSRPNTQYSIPHQCPGNAKRISAVAKLLGPFQRLAIYTFPSMPP